MKKTIYHKYDKQRIPDLPKVLFEGRIVVILTESEAQKAVDYLLSQPILGVDTETRPSFKKGRASSANDVMFGTTTYLYYDNRRLFQCSLSESGNDFALCRWHCAIRYHCPCAQHVGYQG